MAVKNTQRYKVSPSFEVVVAKTTGAFRKLLSDVTEGLPRRMADFKRTYPEISANNELPSDQMAIFLLGRKGFTTNPETLHYDEATGILSLEIIMIDDNHKLVSSAIIFAPLRDEIIIQSLGILPTSRADFAFNNNATVSISVDHDDSRKRVITQIKPASTRPV